MDNATYDGVSVTPISNDETYSQLRTTHNKVRPRNEIQRSPRADIDQNTAKGVKQTNTKEAPNNTKVNTVLITITILLILTLVSIHREKWCAILMLVSVLK
jgi:hypothetical protein